MNLDGPSTSGGATMHAKPYAPSATNGRHASNQPDCEVPKKLTREDRITRILRLGAMLRENSGAMRADAICSQFKISKRTFYRDIRLLRSAGAAVTYRADTGAYEAELLCSVLGEQLSQREAAAILASLNGARPRRETDFGLALESARSKFLGIVEQRFRREVSSVMRMAAAYAQAGDRS